MTVSLNRPVVTNMQGGIYNLPTHLSHGARDLIPRMLVVDPLKRITIPEIRCSAHQPPAPQSPDMPGSNGLSGREWHPKLCSACVAWLSWLLCRAQYRKGGNHKTAR